ncbi:MAG: CapA family protein [Desulfobacteraceae bacterium]|nr:CapA family protein [Desulfobacteraceae bacterium]
MKLIRNHGQFPGVPEDSLLGEWSSNNQVSGTKFRLVALGDLGLSGKVGIRAHEDGNIDEVFREILPALHAADLVMANLETPLLNNWSQEKMFAGSSRWVPYLAQAGFDILHLASNHMLDFGPEGFAQTIKGVQDSGITIIGAGTTTAEASRLVVEGVGGSRIGWLAAGHTNLKQPVSPRLWELDVRKLLYATERARDQVDLLIISLHWGPMLIDYPYLEQYHAAHRLVDAGASAVLMHHAHVLQGVEIFCGVPICYSLGNLIFDPTEGEYQEKASNFTYVKYEEQVSSCIFGLTWQDNKFKCLHAAPFVLPEPHQLEKRSVGLTWPSGPVAERILTRLNCISKDLKGDFSQKLAQQLQAIWKREISINANLILKQHEFWRILYLIKQVRWKHIRAIFGMILSFLGDLMSLKRSSRR